MHQVGGNWAHCCTYHPCRLTQKLSTRFALQFWAARGDDLLSYSFTPPVVVAFIDVRRFSDTTERFDHPQPDRNMHRSPCCHTSQTDKGSTQPLAKPRQSDGWRFPSIHTHRHALYILLCCPQYLVWTYEQIRTAPFSFQNDIQRTVFAQKAFPEYTNPVNLPHTQQDCT